MPRLMAALELPDKFATPEGCAFSADEAITILLLRLTTPRTLHQIHADTGRRPGHTSALLTQLYKWFDSKWTLRLLQSDLQHWTPHFQEWADAIFEKTGGMGLDGCVGFIDGTLRGTSRPSQNQQLVFNGHHWAHGLVFQAWVAPNGLTIDLSGPVRGRRHDVHLLKKSKLLPRFKAALTAAGIPHGTFVLYCDAGYHLSDHLVAAFRQTLGAMAPNKRALNRVMSTVRIAVEWGFGRVANLFGALEYKTTKQMLGTPVALIYRACTILANAHCCLYGNQTSSHFNLRPPTLEEYFQGAPPQPGGWAQADDSDLSV